MACPIGLFVTDMPSHSIKGLQSETETPISSLLEIAMVGHCVYDAIIDVNYKGKGCVGKKLHTIPSPLKYVPKEDMNETH